MYMTSIKKSFTVENCVYFKTLRIFLYDKIGSENFLSK